MTAARCGLYGKLPVKRDFIALNLPDGFLAVWEDWLQSSVAASREQLRDAWLELFLAQPIWRFWLGPQICGQAVVGAFMPSVDGVGRYFPLCVCASAGSDAAPLHPASEAMNAWFAAAESALLRALDPDFTGAPLELLSAMPDLMPLPATAKESAEASLSLLLGLELQNALAGETWWWSLGGGNMQPRVIRLQGLPDPYKFSGFLTSQPDMSRGAI